MTIALMLGQIFAAETTETKGPSGLLDLLIKWLLGSTLGKIGLVGLMILAALFFVWKALPTSTQERIINRFWRTTEDLKMPTYTIREANAPISPTDWQTISATISAMAEVIRTKENNFDIFFEQYLHSAEIGRLAASLSQSFSTYSDGELQEIAARLEKCRKAFQEQFSGEDRTKCLCSILRNVKDGNGGLIPVSDWWSMYELLKCDRR
jgi:hypothetical protein